MRLASLYTLRLQHGYLHNVMDDALEQQQIENVLYCYNTTRYISIIITRL